MIEVETGMKYLFDMGEVWHVYADMGNQWIYYRMDQKIKEVIEKDGDDLPGPLGRLELFQHLEEECQDLSNQLELKKQELESVQKEISCKQQQLYSEIEKLYEEKQQMIEEKKNELHIQRQQFETAYMELQKIAEGLQQEGKQWRQRYLDLAYQISPKGL